MPVCQECGGFVTARYAQVKGVREGGENRVYGCRHCCDWSQLIRGAARPDKTGTLGESIQTGVSVGRAEE